MLGKLKGIFGGGNTPVVDESQSPESVPAGEPERQPSPSASSSGAAETTALPKDILKDLGTIPLNVTVKFASLPPMTAAEKRAARNRY